MHRCVKCGATHDSRLEARRCCMEELRWRQEIPMNPSFNRELAREDVLAKLEEIQYEE